MEVNAKNNGTASADREGKRPGSARGQNPASLMLTSTARAAVMPLNTMADGYKLGLHGYSSPLNYLLVCVPLGILAGILRWNDSLVFVFNFIGCVPLATILGRATEDVADHTNETIGGLINATFGNAVEIILSIAALRTGQLDVVRSTLIGSILSNLLLVLGSSLFFGGLLFREQRITPAVVEANSLALGVAAVGFVLPTLFSSSLGALRVENKEFKNELFSLLAAILILIVYVCYLVFQLFTHADDFDEDAGETDALLDNMVDAGIDIEHIADDGFSEGDAKSPVPMKFALAILVVDVLIVSLCSEFLVSSIEGFSKAFNLSPTFVALILLPVIGNAVEHLSAVMVAMKNKMDLAIGIACGSSVQIAMFAAPLMVILSWLMGGEHLTLAMNMMDLSSVVIAVGLANLTLRDSSSNWLEGITLIIIYLMVGCAFYLLGKPVNVVRIAAAQQEEQEARGKSFFWQCECLQVARLPDAFRACSVLYPFRPRVIGGARPCRRRRKPPRSKSFFLFFARISSKGSRRSERALVWKAVVSYWCNDDFESEITLEHGSVRSSMTRILSRMRPDEP
ncbi:Vacuolar calcium ion transporter [Porphyridium purpureum]|uniref:Vacuolar calcium ion transporter n=1 Tax=Porphyridium purpureum TaxID=35688 RepID=A0A5J4Z6E3_PORPP|nr:Vacuolar calcium ion transporter [Porphyridium purpureum]|eukprot:POR5153..scf295_1